ncbi:hypothetical protein V6N13_056251 [Hibiscus sabdariffa]
MSSQSFVPRQILTTDLDMHQRSRIESIPRALWPPSINQRHVAPSMANEAPLPHGATTDDQRTTADVLRPRACKKEREKDRD